MARRHRNGYRFTEKTHSKRGVAALFLSIISIGILMAAVVSSFDSREREHVSGKCGSDVDADRHLCARSGGEESW